jgi:hypothetical protein
MDRMGAAHEGRINLVPAVNEDDVPGSSVGLGNLFSSSGPEVPVCTWAAGKNGRRGIERDSLGIEHATGTKVVARLATLHIPVPEDWRTEQDHPRRGLVLRPPIDMSHKRQLTWLIDAGTALSRIRLTGLWEARVRPAP